MRLLTFEFQEKLTKNRVIVVSTLHLKQSEFKKFISMEESIFFKEPS